MMRASTWRSFVMMPDWLPVKLIAAIGARGHSLGEREQVVGGIAHGGHHDTDVVPLLPRAHDPRGDVLELVDVRDTASPVFLHHDRHPDRIDPRKCDDRVLIVAWQSGWEVDF
jgi:hypothetical protein